MTLLALEHRAEKVKFVIICTNYSPILTNVNRKGLVCDEDDGIWALNIVTYLSIIKSILVLIHLLHVRRESHDHT